MDWERQLQDETRNIYVLGFSASYIRELAVHSIPRRHRLQACGLVCWGLVVSNASSAFTALTGNDNGQTLKTDLWFPLIVLPLPRRRIASYHAHRNKGTKAGYLLGLSQTMSTWTFGAIVFFSSRQLTDWWRPLCSVWFLMANWQCWSLLLQSSFVKIMAYYGIGIKSWPGPCFNIR